MEVFVVKGACVTCNTPVELELGYHVDDIRWILAKPVKCSVCGFLLVAALRDQTGRFWGRRWVWNE
jgi:hypothetical protein